MGSLAETKYLVTGGQGFLGGYIVKNLFARKAKVALFDVKKDDHILQQVLTKDLINQLDRTTGGKYPYQ
jgi:nucleoside-diphosphate-sugar epimerase